MTPSSSVPQRRPDSDVGAQADEGWGDHSWAQAPEFAAADQGSERGAQRAPLSARPSRAARLPTTAGAPAPQSPRIQAPTPQPTRLQSPAPTRRPQSAAEASELQRASTPSSSGGSSAFDTERGTTRAAAQRRLPALVALLVLAACLAVGIVVDQVVSSGAGLRIGLIVGSLLAVLSVRFRSLFAVVVSPPLAFILGSAAELVVKSGGLPSRTDLLGFATGWLVYGFPTIAAASAIVLVVAGVRRVLASRSHRRRVPAVSSAPTG